MKNLFKGTVGGNTIPGEGFSDITHQKMARDRLKNCADIEIIRTGN